MSGRKQLCVYTHSANSKVFYVGQGSQTRAYAKTPRPPAWKSHVGVVGKYDVNIVHWADDRDEAVRLAEPAQAFFADWADAIKAR